MGKKSSPPPPDYAPVAKASAEATQVSADLAREQMAEARRQYEDQKAIAKPIVDAQLEAMRQGIDQGADYYEYMKSRQRPIEDQLQADALKDNTARDQAELNAIEGANRGLADKTLDIGRRQQAAGMSWANSLRGELGGIESRYGAQAERAMAEMRAAAGAAGAAGAGIRAKAGQYEGQINSDINLYTGGNEGIRARFGKDIEEEADRANADVRAGQAQAQGSALRQALRYGLDPSAISGDLTTAQASQIAAATNQARLGAQERFRGIVGQGIGMRQGLMNSATQAEIAAAGNDVAAADLGMRAAGAGLDVAGRRADMATRTAGQALAAEADAQDRGFAAEGQSAAILAQNPMQMRQLRMQNDATSTAKKMDIAGMYRGLTGASQGAYGMAVGAGSAANANNAMAGNAFMQNMAGANQLQMSGRQMALNGLGGILNSQTSIYNNNQGESFGSIAGGVAGLAGAGLKLYGAFGGSDRRMKVNIEHVGRDERTGLNLYEFAYKWAPDQRFRGVMADEVLNVNPDAVITGDDGYMRVNYGLLGLEMTEA